MPTFTSRIPLAARTITGLAVAITATLSTLGTPAAHAAVPPAPTVPAPTVKPTGPPSIPPPCGPLCSQPPITIPAANTPAGPALRDLAARIQPVPADDTSGRYSVLAEQFSAADSTYGDCVQTVTDRGTQTAWRDEIRSSGATYGIAMHPATDPAPRPRWATYGPGLLPGVLPGPVPADPAALARELDAVDAGQPAVQRVITIQDVAGQYGMNAAQRRAVLLVLADVSPARLHSPLVFDGRPAVAVTADQAGNRYLLIIDQASGQIRATETVLLDPRDRPEQRRRGSLPAEPDHHHLARPHQPAQPAGNPGRPAVTGQPHPEPDPGPHCQRSPAQDANIGIRTAAAPQSELQIGVGHYGTPPPDGARPVGPAGPASTSAFELLQTRSDPRLRAELPHHGRPIAGCAPQPTAAPRKGGLRPSADDPRGRW